MAARSLCGPSSTASAAAAQFLHRANTNRQRDAYHSGVFDPGSGGAAAPQRLPKGDYELVRCIADEADDDFLDAEEAYRKFGASRCKAALIAV